MINWVITGCHIGNLFLNALAYKIIMPFLAADGDPEPNKGLMVNKLQPVYNPPISIAFVVQYLRLSALPSFFYAGHHLLLCAITDNESLTDAFATVSDLATQISFTVLICCHCLLRFTWMSWKGVEHRTKVLDGLEMRGNESVLCVRCEKGFWLSGLGKCMKAGGKAFGVDQWDAEDCQYDGQWADENSRREDVSSAVEVLNYGDPHFLTYKDEVFDVVFTTWIEAKDEINYFNAVSEFLRVTRPGGTLAFCQQIPRPPNLIVEHLKDLGMKDIKEVTLSTGYLANVLITAVKPEEQADQIPPKILTMENAVTDESPGFDGHCMLYFLSTVGFYTVVAFMTMTFLFWSAFEIPKSVVAADSMAYGLMAENSVWFCWAIVEVHLELAARPMYMVKRMGIFQLWFGHWLQFFIMVVTFNLLTWLPVMILALITGGSSLAFRTCFRVIARPIIGMTLDKAFAMRRMTEFLKTWRPSYGDEENKYKKPKKKKKRAKQTDNLLGDHL